MTKEQVKQITSIKIEKLWGHVNIDWQLDPKVNILVGKNGVGKTTLLNLIEHLIISKHSLMIEYEILKNSNFQLAKLSLNSDQYILLFQNHSHKNPIESIDTFYPFYQIESNIVDDNNQTKLPFSEVINLTKISTFEMLIQDFQEQKRDNRYIQTELDFILNSLINEFKSYQLTLKKRIESKVIDLDQEIQRLLYIADNSEVNSQVIQLFKDKEKITAEINRNKELFLDLINELFAETNKKIDFDEHNSIIFRKPNEQVISAYQLSSGEKQILIILLKILLQENKPYIVLMDEPELSLHLSWQLKLIDMIQQLNPNCQLIIVTHAPGIFSKGWRDKVISMENIIKE